jgi:hypothetical protein
VGLKILAIVLLLLLSLPVALTLNNLKTGSMPCFQGDSDISVNSEYPFEALAIGDVICYKPSRQEMASIAWVRGLSPIMDSDLIRTLDGGSLVCHRISYIGDGFVITKADVSIAADPFSIHKGEYYGRVDALACYSGR